MVNRDLEKLFFFQNALKMSVTTIQCGQMRVLKLLILWLYVLATSTCCSLKTNPHFLQFSRLNIQFPDFFHAWKIALQISRLFQEFKTLYEPHDYCNSSGGGGLYRNKPVLFCQCLQVVFNFFNLWFFNLQSTFKISYPELNKKSEIIS